MIQPDTLLPSPTTVARASDLASSDFVDFRRSLPPVPADLHVHMAQAFNAIAARHDLGWLTHQTVSRGVDEDRVAGCQFLASRLGKHADPSRLLITNGTQSAVMLLLKQIVGPGGLLLSERLSYSPVRLLAKLAGVQIRGVDIDQDGILPGAFEAICRTANPKALYCNPTVQNPTTAIMPAERRLAISAIARRYGVVILEDEALGRLHLDAPAPIAAVAPDVTWYVMSTTKCLSHGLRLAYLVAPSCEHATRVVGPVEHLSFWHPAPLLSAMVTEWISSGAAENITNSIAQECVAREAMAQAILADFDLQSRPGSMHVWLTLPGGLNARDFADRAEQHGVLLRSSMLFAVDDQATPNAVRLSLSTPKTLGDVKRGLELVRTILEYKR